jgi:hypothetical protein
MSLNLFVLHLLVPSVLCCAVVLCRRKGGVSLLSQQIACARSMTAAAAPEDAQLIEAAGGASGRGRGQFWRYIQVWRAQPWVTVFAWVKYVRPQRLSLC